MTLKDVLMLIGLIALIAFCLHGIATAQVPDHLYDITEFTFDKKTQELTGEKIIQKRVKIEDCDAYITQQPPQPATATSYKVIGCQESDDEKTS